MNGWRNVETWLTALWWMDDLELWINELWDDGHPDFDNPYQIAKHIEEFINDFIDEFNTKDGFITDVIYHFIAQVDFNEIAEHIYESWLYHKKEVEDEIND